MWILQIFPNQLSKLMINQKVLIGYRDYHDCSVGNKYMAYAFIGTCRHAPQIENNPRLAMQHHLNSQDVLVTE